MTNFCAVWKEGKDYTSCGFDSRKDLKDFLSDNPQALALTPRENKELQAQYDVARRSRNDLRALQEFEEMFQDFCAKKFKKGVGK